MTDDKHRRQWLAMLAKLVCPMDAPTATKALCDMLPMLSSYDESYFTRASLEEVAARFKRVPTYGELRTAFGAIRLDSLPRESDYPQLPGPTPEEKRPPTDIEKAAVATMVEAFKTHRAKRSSAINLPEHSRPKPHYLTIQQRIAAHEDIGSTRAAEALRSLLPQEVQS